MGSSAALPDHEHAEIVASGLELAHYHAVRSAGATHDEVMEAHVLGADLPAYTLFRVNHSHRRALDEAGTPNSPTHQEAGRLGVTDRELAEVRASHRATVDAYWSALTSVGRPDHELAVTRVGDYLTARRAGLAHGDALRFAMRVATLERRPDTRDLTQWARCLAAGLDPSLLFVPARRLRRSLVGRELEVLHAVLFAVRSLDSPAIAWSEMEWVAVNAAARRRPFRVDVYIDARVRTYSRRVALRWATTNG
jgi:hypothetical protein